jgi:hypothetical protein
MLKNITNNQRIQIISVLSKLRQEWQGAAQGESLLDIEANVGLIFADLVNSFGLPTHEQSLVLGPELFDEMREVLTVPNQN